MHKPQHSNCCQTIVYSLASNSLQIKFDVSDIKFFYFYFMDIISCVI